MGEGGEVWAICPAVNHRSIPAWRPGQAPSTGLKDYGGPWPFDPSTGSGSVVSDSEIADFQIPGAVLCISGLLCGSRLLALSFPLTSMDARQNRRLLLREVPRYEALAGYGQ